ncbi:hypothetical protein SORBI_3003G347440 [Sorghum bicolor]|uniref:Uncharacterized protein n=1 Tax=Sorghum bicolor TaxID=4558 RepID=A0A1W0W0A0_SORBI|nr:hypothetical protein SORBI_3003G347440 [Sorghum bicolor]
MEKERFKLIMWGAQHRHWSSACMRQLCVILTAIMKRWLSYLDHIQVTGHDMVRLDAVATLVTMHAGGTIRFMNEVDTSIPCLHISKLGGYRNHLKEYTIIWAGHYNTNNICTVIY